VLGLTFTFIAVLQSSLLIWVVWRELDKFNKSAIISDEIIVTREAKMRVMTVFIFIAIISLFLGLVYGFAQEQVASQPENQTQSEVQQESQEGATPAVALDTDIQWLWGEVVSADFQKNELLVKYVDYETDIEKVVTVVATDKTTYENVQSLIEIKPQDVVSIDYTLDSQGRNIAKNISVEKPEAAGAQ